MGGRRQFSLLWFAANFGQETGARDKKGSSWEDSFLVWRGDEKLSRCVVLFLQPVWGWAGWGGWVTPLPLTYLIVPTPRSAHRLRCLPPLHSWTNSTEDRKDYSTKQVDLAKVILLANQTLCLDPEGGGEESASPHHKSCLIFLWRLSGRSLCKKRVLRQTVGDTEVSRTWSWRILSKKTARKAAKVVAVFCLILDLRTKKAIKFQTYDLWCSLHIVFRPCLFSANL